MSPPEPPAAARGLAAGWWAALALALFLGLGVAGYVGCRAFVVEPRCRAACAARGQAYASLYAGQRGPTRPAACVCDGGARVTTSGPDLMVGCGAGLGLLGLFAAARLAPGGPQRRRRRGRRPAAGRRRAARMPAPSTPPAPPAAPTGRSPASSRGRGPRRR